MATLHRLPQDELFHFYLGDPVEMLQIFPSEEAKIITLGQSLASGEALQVLVPGGIWQGTRLREGGKWALLGCTVVPGFEYADNEIGKRADLVALFPKHQSLILKYTRG